MRISTSAQRSRRCSRFTPGHGLFIKLCVALYFIAFTAPAGAARPEVQQEPSRGAVKIVFKDFKKIRGNAQYDRLKRAIPEMISVALLPYERIIPISRGALWRYATQQKGLSTKQLRGAPQMIFDQRSLEALGTDYVVTGEFLEANGVLEVYGVVKSLKLNREDVIGPFQVEIDKVFTGMSRFSMALLKVISEKENFGYAARKVAIACFADLSPNASSGTRWVADDLKGALSSYLGRRLRFAELVGVGDRDIPCEDRAAMFKIASELEIDALIGGSYRIKENMLFISPFLYIADKKLRVPMPERFGNLDHYLSLKNSFTEDTGNFFNGILSNTGKWKISDELLATDATAKEYLARAKDLFKAGDPKLSLVFLDKILVKSPVKAASPEIRAEAHYYKGLIYLSRNSHLEAVKEFDSALTLKEDFAPAHIGRGDAFFRENKPKLAREAYQAALRYDPESALIYQKLGNLEYFSRNYDKAKNYFLKTVEINPENPDSYYQVGLICRRQGDSEDSITWFEKALAVEPGFTKARDQLASIFDMKAQLAQSKRRYEQAIIDWTRAISYKPTADNYFYRAVSYGRQITRAQTKDYSKAIDDYIKSISLAEERGWGTSYNSMWALLNLTELQVFSGEYDQAIWWAQEALRKFSDKVVARVIGGYLLVTARILANEDPAEDLEQLHRELNSGKAHTRGWKFDLMEEAIKHNASIPAERKKRVLHITQQVSELARKAE